MPADEERHDVAPVAEEPCVAETNADDGESDEQRRSDDPREEIARLHRSAECGRERLLRKPPVEDLVGRGEVWVIDEMRDEQHRGRDRRAIVGVGQHEHQRQQKDRASAKAQEVDHRAEKEALVARALFGRGSRNGGIGKICHG